jgi:hypothetical protein
VTDSRHTPPSQHLDEVAVALSEIGILANLSRRGSGLELIATTRTRRGREISLTLAEDGYAALHCQTSPHVSSAQLAVALTHALFALSHIATMSEPPHQQSDEPFGPVARYDVAVTDSAGGSRMPGPEDHVLGTDKPAETRVPPENLQQRLERLPPGHPSSPYNDNGSRKPPPPNPRPNELPLPDDPPDQPAAGPPDQKQATQNVERLTGPEVGNRLDQARRDGLDSVAQHTSDQKELVWSEERRLEHDSILEVLYDHATDVPSEGKAVIAGGLPGAGKTTVLELYAEIEKSRYLKIDPDQIKEEMARRDLIPNVEGLSPMERGDLVHDESSYLARRLANRAQAEGKNLIWDISMSSVSSTERRINDLRAAGYSHIEGIFVDIPVETSIDRALDRHKLGQDAYHGGKGYGGRYMPPEIINAQADEQWGSSNRKNFETLKGRFDAWSIYDNSVNGGTPALTDSSDIEKRQR